MLLLALCFNKTMDNKMKYVFFLVLLTTMACTSTEEKISIRKSAEIIIGDSADTGPAILGDIADYTIDEKSNVYVLDRAFKKIKMYDKEGVFVREYGKGEGRGPGEFIRPSSIDIDKKGNLYVVDMSKQDITVYDSSNNVIRIFHPKYAPAKILVTEPGVFYILSFPFSHNQNLIHKYVLMKAPQDEMPIKMFGQRYSGADSAVVNLTGAIGAIEHDKVGDLFYSYPFPYKIIKYDRQGSVRVAYTRSINDFTGPHRDSKNSMLIKSDNIVYDLILVNDSIIAARIFQDEKKKQFCDFYNIKDGKYIGTLGAERMGIEKSRKVKGNGSGYLYYECTNTFPHIKKVKIELVYEK